LGLPHEKHQADEDKHKEASYSQSAVLAFEMLYSLFQIHGSSSYSILALAKFFNSE